MVARFPIASGSIGGSARIVVLTGLSNQARGAADYERNPHQPYVPDSVVDLSADLHQYLQEQASILRETYDRQTNGVSYRPVADLTAIYTEEVFPLGTQAEFFSDEQGQVLAIFCQFADMDSNYAGAPVGTVQGATSKYRVTNRLNRSTNRNVIGLLPQDSVPDNDQFAWVVVQGPNLQPVRVLPNDTNIMGAELGWGATGFLTSNVVGAVIATQVVDQNRDGANPYEAGEIDILKSSSIGTALVGAANTRIDELTVTIQNTNASITSLERVLVTADEGLAQQIQTISTSLGNTDSTIRQERTSRIAQGNALAQTVTTLRAELNDSISSQIQTTNRAFASGDQTLAQQITALETRFSEEGEDQASSIAAINEQIRVLSDQSQATVTKFTQLDSTITDPATGIAANAAAIQTLETTVTGQGNDISAQATSITNLSTQVGTIDSTLTGTVNDVATVQSTLNGVVARRTIQVNANGVVTGIEFISGSGGTSSIQMQADRFRITNSSGTGVVPFEIVGGVVFIDTARIRDLTIGTTKLANFAVTNTNQMVASGTQTNLPLNTNTDKGSVNLTQASVEGAVIILVNAPMRFSSGVSNVELRIVDGNGTVQFPAFVSEESLSTGSPRFRTVSFSARFAAGTTGPWTVRFTPNFIAPGASVSVGGVSVVAIEVKK